MKQPKTWKQVSWLLDDRRFKGDKLKSLAKKKRNDVQKKKLFGAPCEAI